MIEIHGRAFGACLEDSGGCSFTPRLRIERAVLTLGRLPLAGGPLAGQIYEPGSFPVVDGAFDARITLPQLEPGTYTLLAATEPDRLEATSKISVRG